MDRSEAAARGLVGEVAREGFAFVDGERMRALLSTFGGLPDWEAFAASWNDLAPDSYLARIGRHRRRRYAVFSTGVQGPIRREPHQPHFQGLQYNHLQGDMERWFEPVLPEVGDSASLRTILKAARELFSGLAPETAGWRIELHQFRIEAGTGQAGQPTPEGMHRDGVDYVLVLLVDRCNIASGTTSIHAQDGRELGSFTLTRALDAALVDDARVYHGVTPVTALDETAPAHRDVLVATFRAVACLCSIHRDV